MMLLWSGCTLLIFANATGQILAISCGFVPHPVVEMRTLYRNMLEKRKQRENSMPPERECMCEWNVNLEGKIE